MACPVTGTARVSRTDPWCYTNLYDNRIMNKSSQAPHHLSIAVGEKNPRIQLLRVVRERTS